MAGKKKKDRSEVKWTPEEAFDPAATLQDIIDAPIFKDVGDEHGHSITAGTRIPFWMNRRLRKLIEMTNSPYEIMSDVLRDAIYRGVWILVIKYAMGTDWNVETKMAAAVDAVTTSRRVRSQVESLIAGLDDMARDGDMEKASEHLTDYVLAAVEIDNDWHREKVFTILNDSKVVKDVVQNCPDEVKKLLEQGGKA